MKFLLPIIILFCFSCKQAMPKLTMADLKFADYEREWIAKNKVDSMYQTLHYLHMRDSIFPYKYDSMGQLVAEGDGTWFEDGKRYEYNSLGYVVRETRVSDYIASEDFIYKFNPDNLLLNQYIIYDVRDTGWMNFKKDTALCRLHYFDLNGMETQKNYFMWNLPTVNTYKYDNAGNIIEIDFRILSSKRDAKKVFQSHWYTGPVESKSMLYYSNGIIDSVITDNYILWPEKHSTTRIYYDGRGLRYKKIERDTLIYTYKYTFRK